jgi:cellobiose phosphorylase
LNEVVSYIEGRKLNEGEESYYDMPVDSENEASVYEHCKQAILHGLQFGVHGLPLIGSGDWNDGMNMVGIEKKGESVWLAFFLYDILIRFAKVADLHGDFDFVTQCEHQAVQLKKNISKHAWDGEWYLRAFFDDGTPLGSHTNEECKIDAISQSWSILSDCAEPKKGLSAMDAANRYLLNREKGIIQLLEPPFNTSDLEPGYIKGYVPGVRENGGQYSHAAIWMIMAFAKLGDREKTEQLIQMINPIHHARTPEEVATYKVEPYVMAADVYGVMPHTGRGGWTWYTGSAGWMYQLILESFLGLKREGDMLYFKPCVPTEWKSFSATYRYRETVYEIELKSDTRERYWVDGVEQHVNHVQLVNDKKTHAVLISYKSAEDL